MLIYIVYHRPSTFRSWDGDITKGIFSTRILALEAARKLDGEWKIVEQVFDDIEVGIVIWDKGADEGASWRDCYKQHWPEGFPKTRGE